MPMCPMPTHPRPMLRRRTLTLALLVPLFCAQAVPGATTGSDKASPSASVADAEGFSVTPTLLESKLKEVAATTGLDDAAKAKRTEQYRKALSNLEAKKSYEARAATFGQALATAPSETQRLRAEVDAATGDAQPQPVPPDLTGESIAQLLAKQQAATTLEETRLEGIDKALDGLTQRPAEARARVAEIKRQMEQLEADLTAPTAEDEAPALTQARRWALQTARGALTAEGHMLDQELASLAVRSDLLGAQRDKAALDLKAMKARQHALETAANDRRRASAEAARDDAKRAELAATDKAPIVQQLARDNAASGDELTALTARLEQVKTEREAVEAEAKGIADDFRSARERLEVAGTNRALGQILSDKRKDLPDLRRYRKAIAQRDGEIADATLAEIRRRDERRSLRDLDSYLDHAMAGVPVADQVDLRDELETLARRRLALLDQLRAAADTYVRGLSEINYTTEQLISTADAYSSFLSERLLWVRSVAPLNLNAIAAIPATTAWLLSPKGWFEVLQTLGYQATQSPWLWVLGLAITTLALRGRALRRAILATAEPMRRVSTDSFAITIKAIALSALVAAPVSMALALVGWQLTASVETTVFAKQVGRALVHVAIILYYLRSFRVLCMPGGVADKHFRWPGDVLVRLRRNFDWLAFLLLPVGFVALVIYNTDDATYAGSLGRLAVLALLLGIAILFARLLHPRTGPLRHFLAAHLNGLTNRLRNLWYPLIVAVPLALVVLDGVVVGVGVEAAELEVDADGEAGLEGGDRQLGLLHEALEVGDLVGEVDERVGQRDLGEGREVAAGGVELAGGVGDARQVLLGLEGLEAGVLGGLDAVEGLVVDVGVEVVGVGGVDPVGLGELAERGDGVEAGDGDEVAGAVVAAGADEGERVAGGAGGRDEGGEVGVVAVAAAGPGGGHAAVVVVGLHVHAVEHEQVVGVLAEEVAGLHQVGQGHRVGDQVGGQRDVGEVEGSDLVGVGVEVVEAVERAALGLGVAQVRGIPAAAGGDHDVEGPGVGGEGASAAGSGDGEPGHRGDFEEISAVHGGLRGFAWVGSRAHS